MLDLAIWEAVREVTNDAVGQPQERVQTLLFRQTPLDEVENRWNVGDEKADFTQGVNDAKM